MATEPKKKPSGSKRSPKADRSKTSSKEQADDKFIVMVRTLDTAVLGHAREVFDDIHELHKDGDEYVLEAFATKKDIAAARKEKVPVKVGANLSAVGRERQKEVAKGDRFKGGKVPPKGLGKKTREAE